MPADRRRVLKYRPTSSARCVIAFPPCRGRSGWGAEEQEVFSYPPPHPNPPPRSTGEREQEALTVSHAVRRAFVFQLVESTWATMLPGICLPAIARIPESRCRGAATV